MPDSPDSSQASMTRAIACSHGRRSASSSGTPRRIFSILPGGCSVSPSSNCQCSRSASRAAMVVLPDPDTPITTSTSGAVNVARLEGRVLLMRAQEPLQQAGKLLLQLLLVQIVEVALGEADQV